MKTIATVVLVLKDEKILLGMKKCGFGKGRWNGFGGKVEKNETIEQAAVREMREESGLQVSNLQKVGILDFEFVKNPDWNQQVHFFKTFDFIGELTESREMHPEWFDFEKIPLDEMWPDDKFWMPILLVGKKFAGKFVFGENGEIQNYEIREVEELN